MASISNKQMILAAGLTVALVGAIMLAKPAEADDMISATGGMFGPLVNTGPSQLPGVSDGRHVAVKVPGIFDMTLDTRGPQGSHKGARLSQSVLSGLVKVFVDQERDETTGRLRGPVQVKVMGMTMYDNGASPLSSAAPAAAATI